MSFTEMEETEEGKVSRAGIKSFVFVKIQVACQPFR